MVGNGYPTFNNPYGVGYQQPYNSYGYPPYNYGWNMPYQSPYNVWGPNISDNPYLSNPYNTVFDPDAFVLPFYAGPLPGPPIF